MIEVGRGKHTALLMFRIGSGAGKFAACCYLRKYIHIWTIHAHTNGGSSAVAYPREEIMVFLQICHGMNFSMLDTLSITCLGNGADHFACWDN
jgi:hypothetical protein